MNLNKIYLKIIISLLTKFLVRIKEDESETEKELVKQAYEHYITSVETTLMYLKSDLKTYERKLDNNVYSFKG